VLHASVRPPLTCTLAGYRYVYARDVKIKIFPNPDIGFENPV